MLKRSWLVSAVLTGAATLLLPTSASASWLPPNTPMYWCTADAPVCTTPFFTTPATAKKTQTSMLCWEDARTPPGYQYPRWLYLRTKSGQVGFVKAEQVRAQVRRKACSDYKPMRAASWALAQIGAQSYQNLCLQFARDAYVLTGAAFPGPRGASVSAAFWWNEQPAARKRPDDLNPPRGALVFWAPDAYNPDGHVAISIGNGMAVSTLERASTDIHVMSIADRNATKPYLGWTLFHKGV